MVLPLPNQTLFVVISGQASSFYFVLGPFQIFSNEIGGPFSIVCYPASHKHRFSLAGLLVLSCLILSVYLSGNMCTLCLLGVARICIFFCVDSCLVRLFLPSHKHMMQRL
ncbi:hypothetical protein AAHE18_08G036000 [Arachis hypogaea]